MSKTVDHDARRRDFIRAAYETITENGLENTTVRAVARKAGYTTGALLHYVANKQELIQLALDYSGEVVRNRMLAANQQQRGRKALHAILLEALPLDRRRTANWRVWLALWYQAENDAVMRREQKRRYREWTSRLMAVLKESVEDGDLPNSVDLRAEAIALAALVDGLGVQRLMNSNSTSSKRLAEMLERYVERMYLIDGEVLDR